WPRPCTVTEVRIFMGVCQYLHKFICHFSQISGPLFELTKGGRKFEWLDKYEDTFRLLRKNISEAPVLALPNLQRSFEVETDASNYAFGDILKQDGKPVEYYYEIFNAAMRNYPTYDKELFALHQC
ncbi:PREDICTED: Retrovirus-related Pol poly from transposon, partial [Prunus dulcis]